VNILVLIILLAPFASWLLQIKGFHKWPVDTAKLPLGITGFLSQQQVSGRLLASPNPGGYLAWRLYPDILISGDMQTPPTIPWDHYRRNMTLKNAQALRRFIEEYRPHLIAIELTHKASRKLLEEHASYRPVFFDDLLALYADAEQLPQLVEQHELKHVNPFNLLDKELGTIDQRLAELETVLALHPDGDRVQHAVTRLLFNEKRYEEALPFARRFVETVPDNPNSHYLLGNVLENLDRCDEATDHYLDAFEYSPADFHLTLHKHLGSCAYLNEDFGAAYRHFKKGVNAYQKQEAAEHLFQYAVSAVAVGDDETAQTVLKQLLYTAPIEDDEVTQRARRLLADL
jgi:tetratricopeptide (TPR) repeat protein